jgi:hypothetical protein
LPTGLKLDICFLKNMTDKSEMLTPSKFYTKMWMFLEKTNALKLILKLLYLLIPVHDSQDNYFPITSTKTNLITSV